MKLYFLKLFCIVLFLFFGSPLLAQKIEKIETRGNKKIESRAITGIIKSKAGAKLDPKTIQSDIKSLYALGYFSDISIYTRQLDSNVVLIVEVKEKPTVSEIKFEGNDQISEEDLQKKISTQLYRVVNASRVADDVRAILQEYATKGYFLADVSYKLEDMEDNRVRLVFVILEGQKVQVANLEIHGVKSFSLGEITAGFITQPLSRSSIMSSRSVYQDMIINRDNEYLSIFYKNNGYAKVKTSKPTIKLDTSKEYVDVTLKVEEGNQYKVGSIGFSGDLIYTEEELLKELKLKSGDVFNYSLFVEDVSLLDDKYGDRGYAYVVVTPQTKFDDEKLLVDIDYNIVKGEKVYIGEITIVGNSKTRDNVIRREVELEEGQLYSTLKLKETKENIERLGFFEEVQISKERNIQRDDLIDLRVRIKEKPTGQLQAAIGFSPGNSTNQNRFFGQGRYEEKNQSGKGWTTQVSGRWNRGDNYALSTDFYDPRVRDSDWSAGLRLFVESQVNPFFGSSNNVQQIDVQETRKGAVFTVGRRIIERIRGSVAYRIEKIENDSDQYLLNRFLANGLASSATLTLSRNATNNFIDPTEGSDISISQKFTGGILGGDRDYAESSIDATYFFPIDFSKTYRTYFRLHGNLSHIYTLTGKPVPFYDRYRLGGFNDMRGYGYNDIGPKFNILQTPGGLSSTYNKGGDKKLFFQVEYFFPLIPEAGIKSLLFADFGQVFDTKEKVDFGNFKKDVGFGFRWITPIAPFRFEWAYPVEQGSLGKPEFIFYFGY